MTSNYDDYVYDDGYIYDDYIPKTNNPGPWILIGVGIYSFMCLVVLPFLVICGNRREKKLRNREQWQQDQLAQCDNRVESIEMKEEFDHPSYADTQGDKVDSTKITIKDPSFELPIRLPGQEAQLRGAKIERKEDLENLDCLHTIGNQIGCSEISSVKAKCDSSIESLEPVDKYTSDSMDTRHKDSEHPCYLDHQDTQSTKNDGGTIAEPEVDSSIKPSDECNEYKVDDTCNQFNDNIRFDACHSDTNSTHSSTSYYIRAQSQGYKINADLFSCESESVQVDKGNVGTLFLSEDLSLSDSVNNVRYAENKGMPEKIVAIEEVREEQEDITFCCGANAMFSRRNIHRYYDVIIDIADCDQESKRLMQLCWPMTISSGLDALFDVIIVSIIANYLGTDILLAYVLSALLIGLTDTFLMGPSDALNTLCSHAIGAGNYHLAGQYVQISAALYLLLGVPAMGIWFIWIGDIMQLMNLSGVADIVSDYTKVVVWYYLLTGLFRGYYVLLDISGYVIVGAIFDTIYGITNVSVIWLLCAYWEGIELYWIGVVELIIASTFFVTFNILIVCKGWLAPFTRGIIGSFALRNCDAVKNVVATAIPLSFGSLLEYGEWEVLTFFVAYLGDAEVAAWGLLESLWEFFEAATSGLSEAASIRVAYHLGNGNIKMAKMASYKSIFMGTCLSLIITSLLLILRGQLTNWLTPDETLREMLHQVMPLIGLANIFMVFGMVAWTLVGSQGRYRLATIISACMSAFVTLPLAAISTFYFMFNLQGIVGAIICGYSTTGLCLGYILLRSDWKRISEKIQEYNAEDDISDIDSNDGSQQESDSDVEKSENDHSGLL